MWQRLFSTAPLIGAYGSHIGADGAAIRLRQGYGGQVAVNAEKEERAAQSFSSRFSPTSRTFVVHHSVRKLSTSPH